MGTSAATALRAKRLRGKYRRLHSTALMIVEGKEETMHTVIHEIWMLALPSCFTHSVHGDVRVATGSHEMTLDWLIVSALQPENADKRSVNGMCHAVSEI